VGCEPFSEASCRQLRLEELFGENYAKSSQLHRSTVVRCIEQPARIVTAVLQTMPGLRLGRSVVGTVWRQPIVHALPNRPKLP